MRPKYLEVTKNGKARSRTSISSFHLNIIFFIPFAFWLAPVKWDLNLFFAVVVVFIFESNEYYCVHESIFNGFRK